MSNSPILESNDKEKHGMKLFISLIDAIPISKYIAPPIVGLGFFELVVQTARILGLEKEVWLIIALIFATASGIVTTIILNRTKLAIRTRELAVQAQEVSITGENKKDGIVLQLLNSAIEESKNARADLSRTLAEQRDRFLVEERETRTHYEKRFDELRQEKHDKLNEINFKCGELQLWKRFVQTKLHEKGITITDDLEWIENIK